ncbi:hypothetical protein RDABS01_025822 [Bienertia sinuspersici]
MILNVYSGSHLLIGDLNQLESSKQKQGGRKKIPLGRWFKNWTISHSLSEIPFKGAPFTWTNNREGKDLIFERLDRAYGNHEWKDLYPNASGWNFPIFLSDHGPISLDTNPSDAKKKRPYRLEAWCYDKDEIREITLNSGKNTMQGSRMFALQRRLEKIKTKCMEWCLNYKKEVGLNWASIKGQLEKNSETACHKTEEENKKLRNNLERETKEQWVYWRQRAKSRWDDWGDQSTSFFFRSVKTRAVKNEIRAIKSNEDVWVVDQTEIKMEFQSYYEKLLRPNDPADIRSEDRDHWFSNVDTIQNHHQQDLERPFTMEEVRKATFDMKPNKTPGPDGIPPGFI